MPAKRDPEPARLWRRLAALAYDSLLVTALLMLVTAALLVARGGAGIESGSIAFRALLAFSAWLYFAWSWTHGGQTVGMRAWRLRLEGSSGTAVGWGQSAARFAAACLAAAPLGLGFWWSVVDRDRRCWHDRLSRTRLVHVPR